MERDRVKVYKYTEKNMKATMTEQAWSIKDLLLYNKNEALEPTGS